MDLRAIYTAVGGSLVAASVYYPLSKTLFAGIPGGDSGELVAEACQLGVAHPPGYPLFIYVARAAIVLFEHMGSPAYRVNFACALMGVMSAVAVYYTIVLLSEHMLDVLRLRQPGGSTEFDIAVRAIAGIVAVMMACSPLMWLYSIGAEVFALNNLMISIMLLLTAQYAVAKHAHTASNIDISVSKKPNTTFRVCILAFWCGMSLTNQHTAILFILPIAVWVAYQEFSTFSARRWILFILCGFAGLLPYVHLPLAHSYWRNPGSWGDASTLRGLLHHFLRQDYGTFKLISRVSKPAEDFGQRTVEMLRDFLLVQLPHPVWGIWILVCGLFAGYSLRLVLCTQQQPSRTGRSSQRNENATSTVDSGSSIGLLFIAIVVTYVVIFHSLSNMPLGDKLLYGVHQRFWMQPYIGLYLLLGSGASCTFAFINKQYNSMVSRSLIWALTAAVVASTYGHISANYALVDNSRNFIVESYGRSMMAGLPSGAILITGYDMQWTSTRYLQACEGFRTDISLLNAPVMSFSWFAAQRHLYPNVSFPGLHLTGHMTTVHAAGAFSMVDFYAANMATDCGLAFTASYGENLPHPEFVPRQAANINAKCVNSPSHPRNGGIFVAGLGTYEEKASDALFTAYPHGVVKRVVPKLAGSLGSIVSWTNISSPGSEFRAASILRSDVNITLQAWKYAEKLYTHGFNVQQYDESTWELATSIDFWNQATATATWLLEWATAPASTKKKNGDAAAADYVVPDLALAAARIFESAIVHQERQGTTIEDALWKNLGLAYMKLVRSKLAWPMNVDWPAIPYPGLPRERKEDMYRTAAATRVLQCWSIYLEKTSSKLDPSLPTIKHVVDVLRAAADRSGKSSTA